MNMFTCNFCGKQQKESDDEQAYRYMLKIKYESPCLTQVYETYLCKECSMKMRVFVGTFFSKLECCREEFSNVLLKEK